jgi:hypothetical protein
MPSIQVTPIFSHNYNYNYNEIYIYHEYYLYKVQITFPQSLLHYQHTSPRLRETLYDCRLKLFAEVLGLLHAFCLAARHPQNCELRVHPSGGQRMEGGRCYIGTVRRIRESIPLNFCNCLPCAQTGLRSDVFIQEEDLIHFPVWPNPSNSLF